MQTQVVQIAVNRLPFLSVSTLEELRALEEIDSVSQLVRNAEAEEYQLDA